MSSFRISDEIRTALEKEIFPELRTKIANILVDCGSEDGDVDDNLLQYIVLLVTNQHTRQQVVNDLEAFFGQDRAEAFSQWLWKSIAPFCEAPAKEATDKETEKEVPAEVESKPVERKKRKKRSHKRVEQTRYKPGKGFTTSSGKRIQIPGQDDDDIDTEVNITDNSPKKKRRRATDNDLSDRYKPTSDSPSRKRRHRSRSRDTTRKSSKSSKPTRKITLESGDDDGDEDELTEAAVASVVEDSNKSQSRSRSRSRSADRKKSKSSKKGSSSVNPNALAMPVDANAMSTWMAMQNMMGMGGLGGMPGAGVGTIDSMDPMTTMQNMMAGGINPMMPNPMMPMNFGGAMHGAPNMTQMPGKGGLVQRGAPGIRNQNPFQMGGGMNQFGQMQPNRQNQQRRQQQNQLPPGMHRSKKFGGPNNASNNGNSNGASNGGAKNGEATNAKQPLGVPVTSPVSGAAAMRQLQSLDDMALPKQQDIRGNNGNQNYRPDQNQRRRGNQNNFNRGGRGGRPNNNMKMRRPSGALQIPHQPDQQPDDPEAAAAALAPMMMMAAMMGAAQQMGTTHRPKKYINKAAVGSSKAAKLEANRTEMDKLKAIIAQKEQALKAKKAKQQS